MPTIMNMQYAYHMPVWKNCSEDAYFKNDKQQILQVSFKV